MISAGFRGLTGAWSVLAAWGWWSAVALPALGQAAGQAAPAATPPIAATVNGEPVYVGEVNGALAQLAQARGRNDASPQLQADVLQTLIHRHLIAQKLQREGGYVSDEELDKTLESLKAQAAAQKVSLEELAARQGTSVDAWRAELIYKIGWARYVERNLTDQLEAYFNEHRKEFDGTQIRASHILLRPERADQSTAELTQRAAKIRQAIEAGKITFEQAAQRFSAGPSRARQGDLGYFPRRGVMIEDFAKGAFALDVGQISEPVVTPFGVHLIRCTDVRPGSRQWTEALSELRLPASIAMFEKLAEAEAQNAKIEFTGAVPYIKPGTNELVVPGGAAP
jgi:parvulin-like peptidyl-prolyl isomerase